MAGNSRLGDLEYLINRYCEDYINPVFDQTVAEVRNKSDKEFQKAKKAADKRSAMAKGRDALMQSENPVWMDDHPTGSYTDRNQKWDWRNMSDDDIVNRAVDKYHANKKINSDLILIQGELFKCFYGNPENYSSEQIKDLIGKLPSEYLENRIYQNFVRHAARYNIPKSKMSYIFHKIWKDSMFGSYTGMRSEVFHSRGSFGEEVDKYADKTARRNLKVNALDDALAYTGTALFDYGTTFGFGGGYSKGINAAKAAASRGLPSLALFGGKNLGKYAFDMEVAVPLGSRAIGNFISWAGDKTGWRLFKSLGAGIHSWGEEEDKHTQQQHQSQEWFGGYYRLDAITDIGLTSGGHDMAYLNALSAELMNKTDLRDFKTRTAAAILSGKKEFLSRSKGSNQTLRKLIVSEFGHNASDIKKLKDLGLSKLNYLWTYDTWMRNLSWQQCRNQAAYWAGVYRYMKVHGEKERTFNGKTMTLDDVAATAMKYVNAADVICTEQNREKKLEDRKRKIATPLMSQYRRSPDSTINIVRTGLYKCGMWAGMMDGGTPAWMKNLKQDDCRKWAIAYIAKAQAVKEAGGSKERYQALAAKAWQYAKASRDDSHSVSSSRDSILSRCNGSNHKLLNIIRSEVRASLPSDKTLASSNGFQKWMLNSSWTSLHRQAAFWAGALESMRKKNQSSTEFNGKFLTRREVAEKAVYYCNAAIAKLDGDHKERLVREQGSKKISSYQTDLLRRSGGSNYKELKVIQADINRWGKKKVATAVPAWMNKKSWQDCHRMAAYYYGVARYIKENHLASFKVGGKQVTFDDASQLSYSYAKAAISRLEASQKTQKLEQHKQHQTGINAKIKAYQNEVLRHSGGSNYKEHDALVSYFKKWGKTEYHPTVPKWMSRMNWGDCHRMAAYYYGVARYIRENKLSSLYIGNKRVTFNDAAQTAWLYNKAAKENLGNQQLGKSIAKATGHIPTVSAAPPQPKRVSAPQTPKEPVSRKHSSSPSYQRSSMQSHSSGPDIDTGETDSKRYAANNVNNRNDEYMESRQTSQSSAATPQNSGQSGTVTYAGTSARPGYNFSTPANNEWFKYLSGLGLNGFSDVTHNLGYVLAMLPDLLISIFTGKTNFSLKNNLLPLSLLTMGILMPKKSGFMRFLLMGLGGAELLNNAGHRILGQMPTIPQGEKPVKRYTTYADEPLDPRIKNPVLKPSERLMMMDIDGVPYVIGISGVPVDAYNKKALPLNVLANAVLRQFDEKKAKAEENLENGLSRQNDEKEEMQRTAAVK